MAVKHKPSFSWILVTAIVFGLLLLGLVVVSPAIYLLAKLYFQELQGNHYPMQQTVNVYGVLTVLILYPFAYVSSVWLSIRHYRVGHYQRANLCMIPPFICVAALLVLRMLA